MKTKTPITDAFVDALKNRTTNKDYYSLCCEFERNNAKLIEALKSLSSDGQGSFAGWENGEGVCIQEKLEAPIRNAEELKRMVKGWQ